MALLPPKINIGPDGLKAWLQKGYSYGKTESGPFQKFSKEGPQATIEDLIGPLNQAGWLWTVTNLEAGMARIDATAGWSGGSTYTPEAPENIWELDPNEQDKGLLEADFPNSNTSGYDLNLNNSGSQLTREALSKMAADPSGKWELNPPSGVAKYFKMSSGDIYIFDSNAPGAYRPSDLGAVTFIGLQALDFEAAYALYLLLLAGGQNFPVEASVIRHTQLVSNVYTVQASFINTTRIISSDSMYFIEDTPSTLLFSVPSYFSPSQFIETPGDLQYGWKKHRPNVTRLSAFKWRIVQNYQFGLWPVKLFGSVL